MLALIKLTELEKHSSWHINNNSSNKAEHGALLLVFCVAEDWCQTLVWLQALKRFMLQVLVLNAHTQHSAEMHF